jgi:hypothetical protein
LVGKAKDKVLAHKAILSVRCEYFGAMFAEAGGGMHENATNVVTVLEHDVGTFRRLLEFLYTNGVRGLDAAEQAATLDECVNLLLLANEYCLKPLQQLCEAELSRRLSFENIGRLSLLSAGGFTLAVLTGACRRFLATHIAELRADERFRAEVEESPQLGLFLFDLLPAAASAADDCIGGAGAKRTRLNEEPYAAESLGRAVGLFGDNNEVTGLTQSPPPAAIARALPDVSFLRNSVPPSFADVW